MNYLLIIELLGSFVLPLGIAYVYCVITGRISCPLLEPFYKDVKIQNNREVEHE